MVKHNPAFAAGLPKPGRYDGTAPVSVVTDPKSELPCRGKGEDIGLPIFYPKKGCVFVKASTKAQAKYDAAIGVKACAYKLKRDIAEDFKEACEEAERTQADVLHQLMKAFVRAVESEQDTGGNLRFFYCAHKPRKRADCKNQK
jgi:hypothetical protein